LDLEIFAYSMKNSDIHERIYQFIIRVIKLTKIMKSTSQNLILINQIVRSATSVGANDQEADAAESKKDFIAKYTIAKKETKETNYWLRIISDTNPELTLRLTNLQEEGLAILKIVSKIIINTKNRV
jgi:four helix bundle protein